MGKGGVNGQEREGHRKKTEKGRWGMGAREILENREDDLQAQRTGVGKKC